MDAASSPRGRGRVDAASSPRGRVQHLKKHLFSLVLDDGAPINAMHFHDPANEHALLMSNELAVRFAELCETFQVRGKFSVLPMPCCLGRMDAKLNRVPDVHLWEFVSIVRKSIAPRFDITPEILTHLSAFNLGTGGFHHVYEDEWVARASVAEMTDYMALAFEILDNVGLPATGMTSPWNTGCHNEADYAEAIGAAQWRVHRRMATWYFLHVLDKGPAWAPKVMRRDPATGQVVVSVPATTTDVFWRTQQPMSPTPADALATAMAGVNLLLSEDGRAGRIPELMEQGVPVAILTHWPSMNSDGTHAGLRGLEALFRRIGDVYGDAVEWVTCGELAARFA